jgi:cyclophilin family peptidyl-prolyl cis-trans isomerase/protein-disulfide isomerase
MKRIASLALMGMLLLSACAPQASTTPTAEVAPTRAGAPAPVQTPESPPTAEAGAATGHSCVSGGALPEPTQEEIFFVQPGDWVRGPENAAVTIIEWADFQCPFCSDFAPLLQRLEEAYPDDVRVAYRHLPLETHDKAVLAAEATQAAGAQGRFWEMHDLLFEKNAEWVDLSLDGFRAELDSYAAELNLDTQRFSAELDNLTHLSAVCLARDTAYAIGVPGTPFVLLNQQPWPDGVALLAYSNLEGMVKFFTELPDLQYDAYPDTVIDSDKQYSATIVTDKGDIVIDLLPDVAPLAVNSFVFLVRDGWYDNVVFHRVIDGFVAQAGDPTGLGFGNAGYIYKTEWAPEAVTYDGPGLVGVARGGDLDTNGAQFFITRSGIGQSQLDALNGGPYTIFGRVREGQEVVDNLTVRDPSVGEIEPDHILSITIEEN